MFKIAIIAAVVTFALTGSAIARDRHPSSGLQKIDLRSNDVSAERDALCAHAASVVARTGVSNNQALSQEQLFSMFLLMSLKQNATQHS
ncbi:MAG TPA: hypothetical protein VLV55_01285 [Rhizomicrobium sp.]|nr:hypothetical protein [Rhizomicrobium sp.]